MSVLFTPLQPRYVAIYAVVVVALLLYFRPGRDRSEPDPTDAGYQAACEGPPLRTIERRDQALTDGYVINRVYDCIDKASFLSVAKQQAAWEAAHTPEAIAKQKADRERLIAEERVARQAAEEKERDEATINNATLNREIVLVDVNTATESELASAVGVGPDVAMKIIEERNKRRFNGWEDVVARVVGLSQAQSAVVASVNGLTVDGQSLPGAEPNSEIAASIRQ